MLNPNSFSKSDNRQVGAVTISEGDILHAHFDTTPWNMLQKRGFTDHGMNTYGEAAARMTKTSQRDSSSFLTKHVRQLSVTQLPLSLLGSTFQYRVKRESRVTHETSYFIPTDGTTCPAPL